MNSRENQLKSFDRLLTIMDELRTECPWDRKQTIESLRHLTIEETYELGDAILDNDLDEIKNELGDLFLHLVFYSKIGSEKGVFDVGDVLDAICEKLIHRHPHVYGNIKVKDEIEVKNNWEKLKLKEGRNSVLEGVPKGLPAMVKAYRILEKVKGIGFEFSSEKASWDKVREELEQLNSETDPIEKENELGNVLFSIIDYAHQIGLNPENALERTNRKFLNRFQKMENISKDKELNFSELKTDKMAALWQQAEKDLE